MFSSVKSVLSRTDVLARQMDVACNRQLDDLKLKWLPKENEVKLEFCWNARDLGSEKFNKRGKLNLIEVWIILLLYT